MATDLGFVAHAAERHAHELAIRRACDALAEGGLADARRTDEAQDRALERLHSLLHREVLEDPLLDLLEAEVVFLEHALGLGEVAGHLRPFAPRHLHEPVDVVANDRGLGRHRRHQLELAELGRRLLLGFLRHAGRLDALLELRELVRRVLHLAELLLNGLHLLIQVVLALALLHLPLHAAADALLDPQHVDLGVDQAEHVLEPRPDLGDLEHLLLLGELQRHLARDRVGEPPRRIDARQRGQDLGRDLLVELHVLVEARHHGACEHFHLARVEVGAVGQLLGLGREALADLEIAEPRAADALYEDFHGAVRQLEQLENRRERRDLVDVLRARVVDVGLRLRDEQDLAPGRHRTIERRDGTLAPDEQRDHRVRVYDHVAQRQDR